MPHITSSEGRILAEKYMEAELSRRHKAAFWPRNLLGVHQVRIRTPKDIAQTEWELAFCKVLSDIGQDAKAEVVEWIV